MDSVENVITYETQTLPHPYNKISSMHIQAHNNHTWPDLEVHKGIYPGVGGEGDAYTPGTGADTVDRIYQPM